MRDWYLFRCAAATGAAHGWCGSSRSLLDVVVWGYKLPAGPPSTMNSNAKTGMSWMLQIIVISLSVALVGAVLLAAAKPDMFRVARTARIDAHPDTIFPLINDLRAMNTWNTFALRDPMSKTSYSGPSTGVGARHTFNGPKSGGGVIEITAVDAPTRAVMRLRMTKPIKADNTVTFTLARAGAGTDVTWAMEGRLPFFIKVMTLFFNHDAMLQQAFDEGLANLKALAENA
jgi:hypothetical protein